MKKKEKKEKKAVQEKKEPRWGYLLLGITFIAIGLCFLIFTSQSIDATCYFIGGVTLFAAVLNAVAVLAEKSRGGMFYLKIILCVFAIVCGVIVMVSKNTALEYIVGIVAFLLIVDGSFKLQTAIKSKSLKMPLWWALAGIVVGVYVCALFLIKFYNTESPKLMVNILGIALIADGTLNLLTPVYLALFDRRQKKEVERAVTEKQAEQTKNKETTENQPVSE